MKNIICLILLLVLVACVNRSMQDYRDDAFSEMQLVLYDQGLNDKQIDKMKLMRIRADSLTYIYEWFQIAETGDSAYVDTKIEKKWPYSVGISFSNSLFLFKKKRRSLRNLFDTTIISPKNVVCYIEIGDNDTINWTVNKTKIIDHIRRGHYTILNNSTSNYIIEFYIYIGLTKKCKYKIETASVKFKKDNKIEITPISVPDSFYDIPHLERNKKIFEYEVK